MREADVFDRRWWQKLCWTIDWLEATNLTKLAQLRHELSCAGLIASHAQNDINQNWEAAVQVQDNLTARLFPWLDPVQYGQGRTVSTRRLANLWAHYFGDPNDPAVQRKIQETTEALNNLAAQSARERQS